jgi:putative intracellular protease/amidase
VIVCTSASELNGHKTGVWVEECAVPYYLFREKGFQVVLASIQGGEIPIDQASLAGDAYVAAAKRLMEDDADALGKLQNSIALSDIDFSTVDAIYLAGGHGTCVDFVADLNLKQAVETVYGSDKIVAADCHGPIGLAQCLKPDKSPLVAGKTVTGFTNAEEDAVGLTSKVPFLIETKFIELGATFKAGDDWKPNICIDGNLFTGQNPASSEELAKAVAKALA